MNNYLITLTPTGKFFFGGDMTFEVKGETEENTKKYSSYIIRSNRFPQQTSLLGMLRFLILRNAEPDVFKHNKIVNTTKASELIGEKGFFVDCNSHERGKFGKIDYITPCFLMDGEDVFSWEALRGKDKEGNEYYFRFDDSNENSGIVNSFEIQLPNSNYDAKKGFDDPFKNVFKEDWRMGIDKDYSGKTKDSSLFKQVALQFAKGHDFKFAFHVGIAEDLDLSKFDGQLVSVGADSSQFIIHIKKQDFSEPDVVCKFPNTVVLTSNAFVELTAEDKVRYAVTQTVPFKFLVTDVHKKNYNRLGDIKHSEKFNLYKAGSVFFFRDTASAHDFGKKIKSYSDFYQIGYNHYQVK